MYLHSDTLPQPGPKAKEDRAILCAGPQTRQERDLFPVQVGTRVCAGPASPRRPSATNFPKAAGHLDNDLSQNVLGGQSSGFI